MEKCIGITGVSGFIGKALAKHFASIGYSIRGLDKNTAAFRELEAAGVLALEGDITKTEDCRAAFRGCDIVIHTAGVIDENADPGFIRKINVDGTQKVAEAARLEGVRKFIHLSSITVYGFNFPKNCDEATPLQGESDAYAVSKIAAEKIVNFYHDEKDFRVYIVRPGDVYGEESIPWVLRPVELMSKGKFFIPGNGNFPFNHVHIDNLVAAIEGLVNTDPTSRAFNIVDDDLSTVGEYFDRLGGTLGQKRQKRLPVFLLKLVGFLYEVVSRLFKRRPEFTRKSLRYVTRTGSVSNQLAKTEIGYSPTVTIDRGFERIKRSMRT